MRQGRTARSQRTFRRTQRQHSRSGQTGLNQHPVGNDLGLCLQTTLRDRLGKLSNKAHVVRLRLNHLIAYLDGRRAAPGIVMGAEGEDIDFLLAEILALETFLARSYDPVSIGAVKSIASTRLHE